MKAVLSLTALITVLSVTPGASQGIAVKPLPRHSKEFMVDSRDDFDGLERLTARMGALLTNSDDLSIGLYWTRVVSPTDTAFFIDLILTRNNTDYNSIPAQGETFGVNVDGQRFLFPSATTPVVTVNPYGPLPRVTTEQVRYRATPEALFALARGKKLTWRLSGTNGYRQGNTSPTELSSLRRFLVTVYPDSTLFVVVP